MTHAPPDPLARLCHTLRRGSDRERRMLGLCWRLGWLAATIAAYLGCRVSTVHRRMRAFDLCGPEQPGERERLLQGALRDRLADDLLAGGDLMKLAPQVARHAPAASAPAPSPSPEPVDTHDNDDLNGGWRKCAARLRAGRELVDRLVPGLETKAARPRGRAGLGVAGAVSLLCVAAAAGSLLNETLCGSATFYGRMRTKFSA